MFTKLLLKNSNFGAKIFRLEALSSTHQLESMRETVSRMRNELMTLKLENEKLQAIVVHQTTSTSTSVVNGGENDAENDRRPLSTMSDNR
jgi:regulator of replication initiation timing